MGTSWAATAQSVQRLVTGCTFRESKPCGRRDCPGDIHTGPGAHQAFYTMDTGSFVRGGGWGVKLLGRGVTTDSHLASRLMKEQSDTSTPHLSLHGLLQTEIYLLTAFLRTTLSTFLIRSDQQ